MSGKLTKIYCLVIAIILVLPLTGTLIYAGISLLQPDYLLKEPELSGVVTIPQKPELSLESLASGTFQSGIEDYLGYHLFARRTSTRLYNQLLYTLFHSTDNREMLVGVDDCLFEKAYATAYLAELTQTETEALEYGIDRLAKLRGMLEKHGIPLIVRMSPSKAELYPECLPSAYKRFVQMKQNGTYSANWYQAFSMIISKSGIPVYDEHAKLVEMKKKGEIVFEKRRHSLDVSPDG